MSTSWQDIGKQRDTIKNWFRNNGIKDYRFVEGGMTSSRESMEKRKLSFLDTLKSGDMLVSTEISRLSRSTMELLEIVDNLLRRGVRVVFISQGLDLKDYYRDPLTKFALHMFTVFAETERDRISQRTKEALKIVRERGGKLGKPRGDDTTLDIR